MTDLIATDVQGQAIDSAFITLFEIELPNNEKAFFHPGLDSSLGTIHFRDKSSPSTINEYIAVPMDIDGLELQSDGALNRPTFSVANVTSVFENELGFTLKDLIGQRLTRRTTLEKYLDDGTGNSSNPPIEFPSVTYVIDRIASENNVIVTFEVAAVHDLEGITLPRRVTRGRYCTWVYKGHDLHNKGGCTWLGNSKFIHKETETSTLRASHFFFDANDTPITKSSWTSVNSTTYANGGTYTPASYVLHNGKYYLSKFNLDSTVTLSSQEPGSAAGNSYWQPVKTYNDHASATAYVKGDLVRKSTTLVNGRTLDTVWECTRDHNSSTANTTPSLTSTFWVQADVCGKKLSSCSCRFQAKPVSSDSNNTHPRGDKKTSNALPFGAYLGLNSY